MNRRVVVVIFVLIIVVAAGIGGYFLLARKASYQRPQAILKGISDKINREGSYKFTRIAGHTDGFVQGEGEVFLPDKLREQKKGNYQNLAWITNEDRIYLKNFGANFDNTSIWRYLGGFGNYAAYEEVRRPQEVEFETLQIGDNWYVRLREARSSVLSAEQITNAQKWRKIEKTEINNNGYIELMFSSFLLHIPDILNSAVKSSIETKVLDGDNAEISYSVNPVKLKYAGVFRVWIDIKNPYLRDPEYDNTQFAVKILVSRKLFLKIFSTFTLKKMEISIQRPNEMREKIENNKTIPGTMVNEAYSISFTSFGERVDIEKPF